MAVIKNNEALYEEFSNELILIPAGDYVATLGKMFPHKNSVCIPLRTEEGDIRHYTGRKGFGAKILAAIFFGTECYKGMKLKKESINDEVFLDKTFMGKFAQSVAGKKINIRVILKDSTYINADGDEVDGQTNEIIKFWPVTALPKTEPTQETKSVAKKVKPKIKKEEEVEELEVVEEEETDEEKETETTEASSSDPFFN